VLCFIAAKTDFGVEGLDVAFECHVFFFFAFPLFLSYTRTIFSFFLLLVHLGRDANQLVNGTRGEGGEKKETG
jgi:hypothetical protein